MAQSVQPSTSQSQPQEAPESQEEMDEEMFDRLHRKIIDYYIKHHVLVEDYRTVWFKIEDEESEVWYCAAVEPYLAGDLFCMNTEGEFKAHTLAELGRPISGIIIEYAFEHGEIGNI